MIKRAEVVCNNGNTNDNNKQIEYKREKSLAKKEREHENIVSNIEKEYNERIEQLKLKIESLQGQLKYQKSIISDQRNKERDAAEKVREVSKKRLPTT
jgi:hypothetical protein